MSEPIQVGDLVVFVRSCCLGYRDGASIFRVVVIKGKPFAYGCSNCGRRLPDEQYAADNPTYSGAPLSWLKRIPPLSELEGEKQKEDLREPA